MSQAAHAASVEDVASGPSASKSREPKIKQTKIIPQKTLEQYQEAYLRRDTLKRELAECEDDIEARSTMLCELVRRGCTIEKGKLTGEIKLTEGRRVPKYKEWIEENLGKAKVAEILANTKPGKGSEKFVLSVRVIIDER